jgi:hypothetical protein
LGCQHRAFAAASCGKIKLTDKRPVRTHFRGKTAGDSLKAVSQNDTLERWRMKGKVPEIADLQLIENAIARYFALNE